MCRPHRPVCRWPVEGAAPNVAGVSSHPAPRDGPGASRRVLATLGAATRADDGTRADPVDWLRRAQEPPGRHRSERHRPTLVTVPSRVRGGRLGVSRSAVLAVLAVGLALVVVIGMRVAWAAESSRPQTLPDPPASALLPPPPVSPTATAVVVHVAGQVATPGIVRLSPGARVVDAIEAAGGATTTADLASVNLARPVVDGEQVYVPQPGEVPPPQDSASPGGPGAGATGGPGATIDLNTADGSALDALPGVGPVLAERIIAWRSEHGRFTSVDELGEVSGIGEKLLSPIRDRVRVGP